MAKTLTLVFNDEVTQEQIDQLSDAITELLEEQDITAVQFVGEEDNDAQPQR